MTWSGRIRFYAGCAGCAGALMINCIPWATNGTDDYRVQSRHASEAELSAGHELHVTYRYSISNLDPDTIWRYYPTVTLEARTKSEDSGVLPGDTGSEIVGLCADHILGDDYPCEEITTHRSFIHPVEGWCMGRHACTELETFVIRTEGSDSYDLSWELLFEAGGNQSGCDRGVEPEPTPRLEIELVSIEHVPIE